MSQLQSISPETRLRALEDQHKKILDEISGKNAEARNPSASGLAAIALRLAELQAEDRLVCSQINTIKHALEEQVEHAKAEARKTESCRKQAIDTWLKEHPPRCRLCMRRDGMKTAVTPFGRAIPDFKTIEFVSAAYASGLTNPASRWFIQFSCRHKDCDSVQRVFPDEARKFQDGTDDDEFPVRIKKGKTQ